MNSINDIKLICEIPIGCLLVETLCNGASRFRTSRQRHLSILYILFYVGIMLIQNRYTTTYRYSFYIYIALHILLLTGFLCLSHKGRLLPHLYLSLLYISLLLLTSHAASLASSAVYQIWNISQQDYYLRQLLVIPLIACISYIFTRFKVESDFHFPISYDITMIITPLINMVSVTLLQKYYDVFPYVDVIGCFSLLTELLMYYMISQGMQDYQNRITLQMMQKQQEFEKQHMKQLSDIVDAYHSLRHDMKNHLVCMDQMISQEHYDELKDYFYSINQNIYALDNQIETGNVIVNQVINIKYAAAQKKSIPMDFQISIPHEIPIPKYRLCSLLSNLIDNALSASEQISSPQIHMEMKLVKDYLSITIENAIEPWQKENAISGQTTKPDAHLHGLGSRIIQSIVQRYNGILTKDVTDTSYRISILLELPEENPAK